MTAKSKVIKDKKPFGTTLARLDDGGVQITFVIPWAKIEKVREQKVKEMATDVTIAGFRKGKAPLDKVREKLAPEQLIEKTLAEILPEMLSEAISEHKIVPAMYPRFELISAKEGEDWQVRAVTCEMPDVELGDYKKIIKETSDTSEIWTPEKGEPAKKELSKEESENHAIKTLLNKYKFDVPHMLIDSEVNSRLSSLLERLERLGLSLESYMASLNKTAQELRDDYHSQAEEAIRLDIILGKISALEKVTVDDSEIDEFFKISQNATGQSKEIGSEKRNTIRTFLTKRKVLDSLVS